MSEEENKPVIPRTFLGRAYLAEIEKGLYGLYRQMEMENPETGQREKCGKPLGPIRILRQKEGDEPVHLRTVHPTTGQMLDLHDVTDSY